jgi:hypothetical protein
VAWHVYDISFEGFEHLTGGHFTQARFSVTRDDGVNTWEVRVMVKPSLREALGEKVAQYDERDLAGGLGAQAILTLLENGLETFEEAVVLDSTHYPGQPGEPAMVPRYGHLTVRVETTPEGEVVAPMEVFGAG